MLFVLDKRPSPRTNKARYAYLLAFMFLTGFAVGGTTVYFWTQLQAEGQGKAEVGATDLAIVEFILDGEVFLQTRSGQAIHAPGAQIYVFHSLSKASLEWVELVVKMARVNIERRVENRKRLVDAVQQAPALLYSKTHPNEENELLSAYNQKKYLTNCDSLGRFSIRLTAGSYSIIAVGRAGLNEAVWWQVVSVPETQRISLAQPIVSYFDSSLGED